jgi:hypothetical protein
VLRECHNSESGGSHQKINRTRAKVVQHCYRLTITEDVENWIGALLLLHHLRLYASFAMPYYPIGTVGTCLGPTKRGDCTKEINSKIHCSSLVCYYL